MHDNNNIKKIRTDNDCSRKDIAKIMEVSESTVQRIESGKKSSLSLEECVRISKALGTSLKNIIDSKYYPLLDEVGILDDTRIVEFDNEESLTAYLVEKESDGRLAILNFPSTIYEKTSGHPQKRFQHFLSHKIENKEYYSIQSFLNFGFSLCSPYSNQEKIDILSEMLRMFDRSHNNQIFMFSQERNYSDIEILYKKSSIVIMLPLLDSFSAAAILIDSNRITDDFCTPYLEESASLVKGYESKKLISILKECLKKDNNSFVSFYKQCENETKCLDILRKCLSPSVAENPKFSQT